VLRSMGNLALSNAHDIREELRFLRRRRGKQEEAIVLSELASLASCLNELVVSTMTSSSGAGNPAGISGCSGLNEEGGNEGEAGNKAGGGAVAVEPSRRSLVGMLSYEGLLPAFQHAAMPAPMAVLGDAALLHYCLEFLVEGRLEHRKQLGDLALVCRQWRDLAQSERFWKPIVLQLFPRLCPTALDHDEEDAAAAGAGTAADAAATAGVGTEGNAAAAGPGGVGNGGVVVGMSDQAGPQATVPDWYRKYLIQFGRCLFDRPIRQGYISGGRGGREGRRVGGRERGYWSFLLFSFVCRGMDGGKEGGRASDHLLTSLSLSMYLYVHMTGRGMRGLRCRLTCTMSRMASACSRPRARFDSRGRRFRGCTLRREGGREGGRTFCISELLFRFSYLSFPI